MKNVSLLRTIVVTLFQGMAVGTAEIIPGVSGSTVALLLGIYDDFIDLLYQGTELVKGVLLFVIGKKSWSDLINQFASFRWVFGISLGIGMVSAIVALSSVIAMLLLEYPHILFAFLFGLIPPTLLIVYRQIEDLSRSNLAIVGSTAAALWILFMLSANATSVSNPHPLHLFVGGTVAISTMVLPGVSGSFMLLILGLYNFVIGLVAKASLGTITVSEVMSLGYLLAGIAAGFFTTVRFLKWAFANYRDQLMSFLLGLLTASWYVLWPFVEVIGEDHGSPILVRHAPWFFPTTTMVLLIGIVVLTAGGVTYLHQWADTHDKKSTADDDGFDRL